ncbi:hypothetical protein [Pantoea agglomerans]|uniref:hypothetical protein n=1 Tax=Enterobacter agglomerans TaxID=549 RepID=UPI003DA179B4
MSNHSLGHRPAVGFPRLVVGQDGALRPIIHRHDVGFGNQNRLHPSAGGIDYLNPC